MSVWTMLGGPVFWVLTLLGVASVFVFFCRLLDLRRAQIDYQDFIPGVANVLPSMICSINMPPFMILCHTFPFREYIYKYGK